MVAVRCRDDGVGRGRGERSGVAVAARTAAGRGIGAPCRGVHAEIVRWSCAAGGTGPARGTGQMLTGARAFDLVFYRCAASPRRHGQPLVFLMRRGRDPGAPSVAPSPALLRPVRAPRRRLATSSCSTSGASATPRPRWTVRRRRRLPAEGLFEHAGSASRPRVETVYRACAAAATRRRRSRPTSPIDPIVCRRRRGRSAARFRARRLEVLLAFSCRIAAVALEAVRSSIRGRVRRVVAAEARRPEPAPGVAPSRCGPGSAAAPDVDGRRSVRPRALILTRWARRAALGVPADRTACSRCAPQSLLTSRPAEGASSQSKALGPLVCSASECTARGGVRATDGRAADANPQRSVRQPDAERPVLPRGLGLRDSGRRRAAVKSRAAVSAGCSGTLRSADDLPGRRRGRRPRRSPTPL